MAGRERIAAWNVIYGIVRSRGFGDALGRIVIDAPDDMLDRLDALIDAYGEFLRHNKNGEQSHVGTDAGKTPDADADTDVAAVGVTI
ncbi:MAG TPA: hypothetical protein VHD87_08935 [Acidimicrobiales bacterium]|nr:hypothetical protein [Acidimicrobiales bacterium]